MVWALPRSLATTNGIIIYFLFLRVLRCFSSPRSPLQLADNRSATCWVVPFGNPRINGYLLLNAAYRSLSRPSSPPRAKASTVCPYLLLLSTPIHVSNCLDLNRSGKYTNVFYALLFALSVQYVNERCLSILNSEL